MTPTFFDGDIIIYKTLTDNFSKSLISKGDIVVAINPVNKKDLIIKRVYKNTSSGIDIRGDNLNASTDSRNFGQISHKNIYGIVEQIISNPFNNKTSI